MNVRTLLANPGNYGGARDLSKIRYIVVHYTGNDGDTAANNARYYRNNIVRTSAHYFVDDDTVWQSVPDNRVAWAVGGKKYRSCAWTGGGTMYRKITNTNSISVEMCDTRRDGTYLATPATIANAQDLIRLLMRRYNIPVSRVYRHFDVTGKLCPAYLARSDLWADFKGGLTMRKDNTPSAAHKAAVDWAIRSGIIRGDKSGDLRLHKPVTREEMCTMLHRMGGGKSG